VKTIAGEEDVTYVRGSEVFSVLAMPTSYVYRMTSMVGAGWNAQTGADGVIRRLFQQDAPGTDPGTPDALKNRRTDGRGYTNQYSHAYCGAAGRLGASALLLC
jgi:hypothetical protein